MKLVTFIALFSTTILAEENFYQIDLSQSAKSEETVLKSILSVTQDEVISVPTTCYRSVYQGERTICDHFNIGFHVMNKLPIGDYPAPPSIPRPPIEPERTCESRPYYSTEEYTCYETKTESRTYKVADVTNSVHMNIETHGLDLNGCTIRLNEIQDQLNTTTDCTKAFISVKKEEKVVLKESGNIQLETNLSIEAFDRHVFYLQDTGHLENVHMTRQILIASIGELTKENHFDVKLKVMRKNYFFKKDELLIDRVLNENEFTIIREDENKMLIDFGELLGGINKKVPHDVTIELTPKNLPKNLINGQLFEKLQSTVNIYQIF